MFQNENNKEIFIQPKLKVFCNTNENIIIKDICQVIGNENLVDKIENITAFVSGNKKSIAVVPIMDIIELIKKSSPFLSVHVISEQDILIEVQEKKSNENIIELIKIAIICVFVFVGAAVAIMNFHADVNMLAAQKYFYKIFTGIEIDRPLIISIPYSIGVGIGMLIFFNHISLKKEIRNQPSPLDLEIYSYENKYDDYIRKKARKNKNNEYN